MELVLSLLIRDLDPQVLRAVTMLDKPQTRRCGSKHKSKRSLRKLPSESPPLLTQRQLTFLQLSSFEIAQRLQAEEEEHERRRIEAEERRQREATSRKPVYAPQYQQQQSRHDTQVPSGQMENMRISQQQMTADQLAGAGKKAKKDKDKECVVM